MRAVLAIGLSAVAGVLFAAGIALPVVSGEDAPLEPSIQNEVDHALYLGEKWLADFAKTNAAAWACATNAACATNRVCATNRLCCAKRACGMKRACATNCVPAACRPCDLFATNSLNREQIALKLVRSQRAGGFWLDPRDASVTNRVSELFATRVAVDILSSLF